jgi:hypothetical protein
LPCLPSAFPFEGVKVEATGKENRIFVSFFCIPLIIKNRVSGTLKHPKWQPCRVSPRLRPQNQYSLLSFEQTKPEVPLEKAIVILFWN